MQIQAIKLNFYGIKKENNNNIQRIKRPELKPLSSDVVDFRKKDLLEQSESQILNTIKTTVSRKNLIGEGGEACVYKIEGTDYCYRHIDFDYLSNLKNVSFVLNEQDRINHVVAKVGKNGSAIMKYLEGSPVATPLMSFLQQKNIAEDIEKMPVEAYSSLLKQISHAKENDMMFDCSNGNVIVNPKENTLTAIDFYKIESPEPFSPMSYMYEALKNEATTPQQKKTILAKIILATINEFEPGIEPCLKVDEYDFQRITNKIFDGYFVENMQYKRTLLQFFDKMKNYKITELKNCNNNKDLAVQIKLLKVLINQLLQPKFI